MAPVNTDVEVFPAQADQLHAASELRWELAHELGADWDVQYPGWRRRFAEYFAKKQNDGTGQTYFARVGDNIVGMASVSIIEDYHAFVRGILVGRINAVFVHPEHRRRGIATALMNACLDWMRTKNCSAARLNSSEQAVPLYESMGFKKRREYELPLCQQGGSAAT